MKTQSRKAVVIGTLFLAASLTGCGKAGSQFVKNVQLRSYAQDSQAYVEAKAILDTGATSVVAAEIPIINPNDPSKVYGKIGLRQVLAGGMELSLALNLSVAAQLNDIDDLLPNGSRIPIAGVDPVIGTAVNHSGAKVYVAYHPGVAMLGTAIPIREFDKLMSGGVNGNLFFPFDFKNGIRGVAGIFTGVQSGQNGIAFFVDAGSVLSPKAPAASALKSLARSSKSLAAPAASTMRFLAVAPASAEQDEQLRYQIYRLNKKRAKLNALLK